MYVDDMMMYFVFFNQKTSYEMLRSLVGSEMCVRDRCALLVFQAGRLEGPLSTVRVVSGAVEAYD